MRNPGFVACVSINAYTLGGGKPEGNSPLGRNSRSWTVILK